MNFSWWDPMFVLLACSKDVKGIRQNSQSAQPGIKVLSESDNILLHLRSWYCLLISLTMIPINSSLKFACWYKCMHNILAFVHDVGCKEYISFVKYKYWFAVFPQQELWESYILVKVQLVRQSRFGVAKDQVEEAFETKDLSLGETQIRTRGMQKNMFMWILFGVNRAH